MWFRFAFVFLFVGVSSAQPPQEKAIWDELVAQVRDLPTEKISPFQLTRVRLEIARSCRKYNRPEQAELLAQQAERHTQQLEGRYYNMLVSYACDCKDFKLAERYAHAIGAKNQRALNKIDIARYLNGEKVDFKEYPRGKWTFYEAYDLAMAYIKKGDYKTAEEFASKITYTKENDPKAVHAMTLNAIAMDYYKKGDSANAKKYINKSVDIGGRLYYTGYCIHVDRRLIYQELTKDLDGFAQRGVRYRGHMARELVQNFIGGLRTGKHYQKAKYAVKYLEKPEDRWASLYATASAQAADGKINDAYETADAISDPSYAAWARISIAQALWKTDKKETSLKLAALAARALKKAPPENRKYPRRALAAFYSKTGQRELLREMLQQIEDPYQKLLVLQDAIAAIAAAEG